MVCGGRQRVSAYAYFVVAKDATAGKQTSPMEVLNYNSTGSDTITIRWPRIANGTDVITYDLIRATTPREWAERSL